MMKTGPEKTDVGGFKGFGFGIKSGTSRPGAPTAVTPAARSGAAGRVGNVRTSPGSASKVSTLFAESVDHEEKSGKSAGIPSYSKLSHEALQAQRNAEALQAADPTIFQFDEVLEDIRDESDSSFGSQLVRTNALEQKKRVGLTLMEGSDSCRAGAKRQAKYVEKVLIATDRRRVEQQIVEDKLLKKDKDINKDREVFLTSGFKQELKRRKKFEDELDAQDQADARKAADRRENGLGFADFHRNLLSGGLASGRGGEKLKEQAAPREGDGNIVGAAPRVADLVAKVQTKTDVKQEGEDEDKAKTEIKDEEEASKQEDVKPEVGTAAEQEQSHGLVEPSLPQAGTKRALEMEDQEQRTEKVLSARERYLARKKAEAEG
jgi:hypothetical protein